MFVMHSRNMFKLSTGKGFDKLLEGISTNNKKNLPQNKFSIDLSFSELGTSLHLEHMNLHMQCSMSPMIGALYLASLLEQRNSSLKGREILVPSGS